MSDKKRINLFGERKLENPLGKRLIQNYPYLKIRLPYIYIFRAQNYSYSFLMVLH